MVFTGIAAAAAAVVHQQQGLICCYAITESSRYVADRGRICKHSICGSQETGVSPDL